LVGIVLNWFLFGILTVQVYIYYSSFPTDSKRIKILVYGIYLVETAQACTVMSDLCFWFAQGFGDLNKLTATYISPVDTPMLGSISSLAVQLFYCHRI
ncbi:uncharacterized protein STEHIDRAFT_41812, partial [Stereum hirsutum FP-91666 SS1]|uniref:uncharacterized protein n=1 Tax=Stereum hirsutum (strain FP-91666) TaxID=721885 RepID=UPI000440E167